MSGISLSTGVSPSDGISWGTGIGSEGLAGVAGDGGTTPVPVVVAQVVLGSMVVVSQNMVIPGIGVVYA